MPRLWVSDIDEGEGEEVSAFLGFGGGEGGVEGGSERGREGGSRGRRGGGVKWEEKLG